MADDTPGNAAPEQEPTGERLAEVIDLAKARGAFENEQEERRRRQKVAYRKLIDRFNQIYAVVNDSGQILVFWERPDSVRPGRWVLDRFSFADFKRMHMNRHLTMSVPDPKKPAQFTDVTHTVADWWLNDQTRREYLGGVVFDPTRTVGRDCWNLWHGFAIEPRRGSWQGMQDHILRVICSGDQEHYDYFLHCAARMVQYPHLPAEVCTVLKGDEGVGKGIILRALYDIIGQHGLYLSHPEHLRGKHNEHLRDKVYLFADEAFYAGDKQHESILKSLVTETSLSIEPKNKPLIEVPNYLHIYMSTNKTWVVPASVRSRRWFVLEVSDHRCGDREYFMALHGEIAEGGLAAMLYDLLRRNIKGFDPRRIPVTAALQEQRRHSLDTVHRWLIDVLDRGFWYRSRHGVRSLSEWHEFCANEFLRNSYMQWCDDAHIFQRQTTPELGDVMKQMFRAGRPRGTYPMHEREALPTGWDRWAPAGSLDQLDLPITEPAVEVEARPSPPSTGGPEALLEAVALITKQHAWGYHFGTLEEARARFEEMTGGLPVPWRADL